MRTLRRRPSRPRSTPSQVLVRDRRSGPVRTIFMASVLVASFGAAVYGAFMAAAALAG